MSPTPEEVTAEEARAALWRAQRTRRVHFQRDLWRSLAGSRPAMRALYAAWQPLILALAEAREPGFPGDDDPTVDPMGQSDTVNVGL